MKVIFRIIILWLFLQGLTASQHPRKVAEPENNIIFERLEYHIHNKKLIRENWVLVKPIAPNVINLNISVTVTQQINYGWLRTTFYHKYNTYKKFLIDVSFEACGFLDGTVGNPVGQVLLNNFVHIERNFELRCPFEGLLIAGNDHLNVSKITLPLLPAGRYRIDLFGSTAKNGPLIGIAQVYFQISDLRVWF